MVFHATVALRMTSVAVRMTPVRRNILIRGVLGCVQQDIKLHSLHTGAAGTMNPQLVVTHIKQGKLLAQVRFIQA